VAVGQQYSNSGCERNEKVAGEWISLRHSWNQPNLIDLLAQNGRFGKRALLRPFSSLFNW
jgi:hypothetical protein